MDATQPENPMEKSMEKSQDVQGISEAFSNMAMESREKALTICQRRVREIKRELGQMEALLRWLQDNRELPNCVDEALWGAMLRR